MSTLHELMEYGKDLGYTGKDLEDFVRAEQNRERDERELERQRQKEEREAEKEMELLKRDTALTLDKLTQEREDREHRMKMELMQTEMELKAASQAQPMSSTWYPGQMGRKCPKLPPFEEGKDNIDSYIERFERYATAKLWPKEDWGSHLSALLKGRALDVFSRLPVADALDFDELKAALFKRFEKTEEGFRKKFRLSRPDQGETFAQFAVRIDSYLEKWVTMSKTDKTYNELKDLMVRDQFLRCCGNELTLFLRERVPDSVGQMARYADQFAEARGVRSYQLMSKPTSKTGQDVQTSKVPGNNTVGEKVKPSLVGTQKERKCYVCGKTGHLSFECKTKKNQMASVAESNDDVKDNKDKDGQKQNKYDRNRRFKKQGARNNSEASAITEDTYMPSLSAACSARLFAVPGMPVVEGYLGDHFVQVLRDSGCSGIVVRRSLVRDDQFTGEHKTCSLADGSKIKADIATVDIDSPYYVGSIYAWVLDTPIYDLIIGNIDGALPPDKPNPDWTKESHEIQAVQTRAQKEKEEKAYRPLKVSTALDKIGDVEELKVLQQNDTSLRKIREFADRGETLERNNGGKSQFIYAKGILYRKFRSPAVHNGKEFKQLVVPQKYRQMVLKLAHDSIMAGHLGAKRTASRVLVEFHWPGLQADVVRFCRSCDICQRTFPKGRVTRVPLGSTPIIDTPFKRIAVDLVGPLQPPTDRGNRYILTIVDYATRYPEAVALKGIETERVAEALVDVFSRVGIPGEMLTDLGSQFTSGVMKEVSRLLSIKRLTTTPYHPMCNGLVERFNGTLKQMLRRMCAERPKDWDKLLNALLFAYREVPQESLGFSPFELLYGRTIRGPMMILKELLTKDVADDDVKTTYQYVMDLRERLDETCKMANEHLKDARKTQRKYYNKKAKDRCLKGGDKVLILLPTKANKLLMQWKGPYTVVERLGPMDYTVDVQGKNKNFHINLLKKYVERQEETNNGNLGGILCCINTTVIYEDDVEEDCRREVEPLPFKTGKENVDDVVVHEGLSAEQKSDVSTLLNEFKDVLTDQPGSTTLAEHGIQTTTNDPVRVKPYPLPLHTKDVVKKEVDMMLEMGIIEQSTSPYSACVVIVKKKDGTNRFCIDFRNLNKVTVFDAEPMPNTEEIFAKLSGCSYFSKLDLSKGYWQVPMSDNAKEMTAFTTPQGLFHFRVMPFGLVNAPATFSRLMRKILLGLDNVDNFIDDIIIFTKTWEEHLEVLKNLFIRLRNAGLTARPTKCSIGFQTLPCLGYVISEHNLQPEPQKIKAILEAPRPITKKQVRSFLGLAGFYRKFIPNFSAVASPLIELTKKGSLNKVEWGENQETAFCTLKKLLTAEPILKLPDTSKDFILRTDASDIGIGAVLLQEEDCEKLPIAYASRKLQPREKKLRRC